MEPCIVKHVMIGTGIPKICIPVVATTHQEIIHTFINTKDKDFDLYELRIDFFEDVLDEQKLNHLLTTIKQLQINQPILFTFRTKKQGGNIEISDQQYYHILQIACHSQCIDIIDVEFQNNQVHKLIELGHQFQLPVLLSNHYFENTPTKQKITQILTQMQTIGGDILKIAVMPRNTTDVLTLLEATNTCHQTLDKPIVTMSMGGLGAISRIVGEIFGSSITFAMINTPSAPGQIELQELKQTITTIHNAK